MPSSVLTCIVGAPEGGGGAKGHKVCLKLPPQIPEFGEKQFTPEKLDKCKITQRNSWKEQKKGLLEYKGSLVKLTTQSMRSHGGREVRKDIQSAERNSQ